MRDFRYILDLFGPKTPEQDSLKKIRLVFKLNFTITPCKIAEKSYWRFRRKTPEKWTNGLRVLYWTFTL